MGEDLSRKVFLANCTTKRTLLVFFQGVELQVGRKFITDQYISIEATNILM